MPDLEALRLHDFIGKAPIDKDAIAFFSTIPHIKTYLDDLDALQPVPFYSRTPAPDTSENSFFNETLNSKDTIPHALLLLRRDIARLEYSFDNASNATDKGASDIPEIVALFSLGPKLNGYRDTVHGGMLAVLLDEVVGFNVDGLMGCVEAQETNGARARQYTAYLNTTYKRPVTAPGVYAVESRLVKRDGRKWFLEGRIVGQDGAVYTEAEVLYVKARDGAL